MYLLMNQDHPILLFQKKEGQLSDEFYEIETMGKLPYGFKNINKWLENRKASKHNQHLKNIMQMCGCDSPEGFIKTTHAASLNDTFWVKAEEEKVSWKEVSFYDNQFNRTVSRLAFEGVGLYGIELSSTSPELTTNGSFRKCWRREKDQIYLYKRGHSGARNAGLEPYSEVLASEIASILVPGSVTYELTKLHGEKASKCKLFTDEKHGYVPFSNLMSDYTPNSMLKFYTSIGAEEDFRRMVMLDAITFNVDRHAGNHGVLVDNESLDILRMAPNFDMNLSLLPYVEEEEFVKIGNKMLDYGPKIGDDFTRIGQLILTPSIQKDLINLKGFEFSFRGDQYFPEWRVKILEQMIEQQISAILSQEVLYTKDVFIPDAIEKVGYENNADVILEKMSDCQLFQPGVILNEDERIIISFSLVDDNAVSFQVDLFNLDMWIEKDHIVMKNIAEFLKMNETVSKAYSSFCEVIDELYEEPEWEE